MSRTRKKKGVVLEIVPPPIPVKTELELRWDQQLSVVAHNVNALAVLHREQIAELQTGGQKIVRSLAEQALTETLENCRRGKELLEQDRLNNYRVIRVKNDELARIRGRLREIQSILNAFAGDDGEIK